MRPFEQMDEQEQRHHVEEIHGVLYLRDEFVAVQHKEDHERLDYPHRHRIWNDVDARLERVEVRVEVKDGGLKGQAGTVVGHTIDRSVKVKLDNDPDGPYYVCRADELRIIGDSPAHTRIWNDPDVKLEQL
jgi:hypothetical protein